MPVMRSRDIEKFSQPNNPETSGALIVPRTATVYLQMPATYRIMTYHLWLGMTAVVMGESKMPPNLLMNTQPWWQPYRAAVDWVHTHYTKYGMLGYLTEVVQNTSDEDLDRVTNFGNLLKAEYFALCRELEMEALELCEELKVRTVATREDHDLFKLWYEGKYESTSAVHRAALQYYASGRDDLANLCSIFMVLPPEAVLAVKKEKTKKHTCRVHDWKLTYIHEEVQYSCRQCGITGDEFDENLPLI